LLLVLAASSSVSFNSSAALEAVAEAVMAWVIRGVMPVIDPTREATELVSVVSIWYNASVAAVAIDMGWGGE